MRPVSCLALMLAAAVIPAPAKDYRAERYDVALNLDRKGRLTVTETVEFRFLGSPFHFVFRDLDTLYTDGISDVRASGPGEVEISNDSPIHVRWNFEPVSDVTRTFTLSYTVAGAIQKRADGDLFVWHPLPRQKKYPIGLSRIRVTYPRDLTPALASVSHLDARWETSPGTATMELTDLSPDRYPELALRFAAGAFLGTLPRWQSEITRNHADFQTALFTGLAAGLLISALVALLSFRATAGRLPDDRSLRLPEAPDSLTPAAAAVLIGRHYPVTGILIDLARRGVLRVDEAARSGFNGRKFKVTLLQPSAQMTPYERLFVDAGFRKGKTEVEMTEFAARTQGARYKIRQAIVGELVDRGLVDRKGYRAKTRLSVIGWLAVILGPPAFFVGLTVNRSMISGVMTAAGAALVLIGAVTLVAASRTSRWTDAGVPAAARWRAFFRYLRDAARGRALTPLSTVADGWLPYAMAFGLAAQLARRQKRDGTALALPDWFAAFEPCADGSDAFVAFLATSGADASGGAGGADGGAAGGGGGASGAG
jgi:Predicted membrane protein (DUF2207)